MTQASKVNSKNQSRPLWRTSPSEFKLPSLSQSLRVDVAIIGGGFSGLWTAHHLLEQEPNLRIAIFEAEDLGFGASGRNGGWVSSDYPVYRKTLKKRHGSEKTEILFTALHSSIDEIGRFAKEFAPKSNFVKAGTLMFARNPAQERRLKSQEDEDHRWLEQSALNDRIRVSDGRGGLFNTECATVNPFHLLIGIAQRLLNRGASIFTHTRASQVEGGVIAGSHFVESPRVVYATEVFGAPGRDFIPLYSQMVATEPLAPSIWDEIGVIDRFTFAEGTHLINYAQRTSDNRLAIGGRGATYPFGSQLQTTKEMTERVHENLRAMARDWFPILNEVEFTHAWGGAVAITRDWEPYVIWNPASGIGRLGGYAGDGVTMSYLAAKALSDQILERETPLRDLHFVNREIRRWEPEPLRYLAVNTLVKLNDLADREEAFTQRPSILSRVIAPLILR